MTFQCESVICVTILHDYLCQSRAGAELRSTRDSSNWAGSADLSHKAYTLINLVQHLCDIELSLYAMRHALSGLILKFSYRFDRPLHAKARSFQTRKMSSPSGRTYAVSLCTFSPLKHGAALLLFCPPRAGGNTKTFANKQAHRMQLMS